MISGKSYAKCLRACLLTAAALHILLLKFFIMGSEILDDNDNIEIVQGDISDDNDDIDDEQDFDEDTVELSDDIDNGEDISFVETDVCKMFFDESLRNMDIIKMLSSLTKKLFDGVNDDSENATLKKWVDFIESIKTEYSLSRTSKIQVSF